MNEEPIELEFVINSPELLEQASQVQQGLSAVDNAVARSENNFQEYINTQLEASNALAQNARLTQEQKKAYDTYANTIAGLSKMMQETSDPTQIGIYEFKIKELTKSIEDLLSRAGSNQVEIVDTEKLEEAGRLIDSISDKTFTPSFASSEELEVLSERLNQAEDEFAQLAVVIDFVNARLESIGDEETLTALQDDISQANDLLGTSVQRYDATGNSINEMTDALKIFREQLANETDADNIVTLNQNIEDLENRIRQVGNAGREGFDELGNAIETPNETVRGLKGQLAQLVQQMAQMRMEGQQNTAQYRELARQATDLAGALSTVNEEVRFQASATSGLDTIIRATKGVASGYALAQSASALFGEDQENLQKTLVKITAVLSLLQGLQTIQAELMRKDSIATKALTYVKGLYTAAIGTSTGALKAFKIALISTGIGAIIVLIGELIANWDTMSKAIGFSSDEIERNIEIGKKANSLYGEKIAKLQMLAATNEKVTLTEQQKKEAVKDYNKEFGNVLGSVKDYNELENKIISNVGNYIEYLNVKAQAEASYMLSLERQKKLLEEITALSTGDLKWYESLQDFSEKMHEKGFELFGIKLGDTKREISQTEILNIVGLPDEADFNNAIKGYSNVIKRNLKNFRKEQEDDKGLLEASYDLQKKAGALAEKYRIRPDEKTKEDKSGKKAFEEKIKALAAIQKAEDDLAKKRLTGLQKDLLDIEQRYAKLREEAKKAKLDANAIERIDTLEKQEVVSVRYTSDTDKLKTQLEASKKIYEEYEEFKKATSEEKANETFKGLVNTQKSYYEQLNEELDNIDPLDMTAEAKERYGMLTQMLIDYADKKSEIERKNYEQMYQTTLSYEQRLTVLKEEYTKKRTDLTSTYEGDELTDRLAVLEKDYREKLSTFFDSFLDDSGFTRNIIDSVSGITKSQINAQIKSLEAYLNTTTDLTKAQVDKIKSVITELNTKLYSATETSQISTFDQYNSEIKKLKTSIDDLDKRKKALQKLGGKDAESKIALLNAETEALNFRLKNLNTEKAKAVSSELGNISSFLSDAANSFTGVNDGVEKMFRNLSKASGLASGMVDSFAKMSEHSKAVNNGTANMSTAFGAGFGYLGMFMSVVGIIDNAFGSGARSRQEQRDEQRRILMEQRYMAELEWQRKISQYEIERIRREEIGLTSRRKELEAMNDDYEKREKQIKDVGSKFQGEDSVVWEGWVAPNGMQGWHEKITNKKALEDLEKERQELEKVQQKLKENPNDKWLLKSEKEIQFKINNLQDNIILTGKSWKELEGLLASGKITKNQEAYVKEYIKLNKELEEAGYNIDDLRNSMRELVTGTSVEDLSSKLAEPFRKGEDAVMSFANTMEEALKNAVVAAFKNEYIVKEMDALFKTFGDMGRDGEYTQAEIDEIRKLSKEAAERLQKQWDALSQLDLDFKEGSTDDKNSLKGAIKGMTENQADLLAGQMGGWRLAQLETNNILTRSFTSQLEMLSRQVALQMQIEVNTRQTSVFTERTAKAVEELVSKSKITQADVLKANGYG